MIAQPEDIAVVSRSNVFSGGSSNSDYVTRHLALTTSNSGSNGEVSFTTAFVPTTTNYMVCFLHISSQHTVSTGGYVKLERV
jgi:hypothetical protein